MMEQTVAVKGQLRPVISRKITEYNTVELVDGVIELEVCLSGVVRCQRNIKKIVQGLANPWLALRTVGSGGLGVVLCDGTEYIGSIGLIPRPIAPFLIQQIQQTQQLEVSVEGCHVGKKSIFLERCWDYLDFVDDLSDEEYEKLMLVLTSCVYGIRCKFRISNKGFSPFSPRTINCGKQEKVICVCPK